MAADVLGIDYRVTETDQKAASQRGSSWTSSATSMSSSASRRLPRQNSAVRAL